MFLAVKKGYSMEYNRAETLESLKQKITTPGTYEIFELVYVDVVDFSHKVTEVRE